MSPNGAISPNTGEDAVARASTLASRALEILNCGLIVTLPEPAQRSRSYRDLILQEMNWMASDFYHERRWKRHAARQICIGIKDSIMDRKRLNKNWLANECSMNMKRFWAGILANSVDSTSITPELADYCKFVGNKYRTHLHTDTSGITSDYYIGERDLIAVTVPASPPQPVVPTASPAAVAAKSRIQKNDVLEMTLLSMQSMGADFYSPIFRPPDDELDMFTMPLMDPVRDDDFNALLVQNFCLKYSDHTPGLSQMKPVSETRAAPAISRKFHRQDNSPSCLAMSVRDFDLQVKTKVPFQGEMIKTKLSAIDFELLDSWMFEDTPSWSMLAMCLTYRSSASGLHRTDFTASYCKHVFDSLSRYPRGLVNSSRRLLGPRQRNAITTFLDAPPARQKFRPLVDFTAMDVTTEPPSEPQLGQGNAPRRSRHGTVAENRNLKKTRKTKKRSGIKAAFLYFKRLARKRAPHNTSSDTEEVEMIASSEEASDTASTPSVGDTSDETTEDTSMSECSVQRDLEVRLPFSDVSVRNIDGLPVTLLQRKENSNIIGIIKKTLSGQKNMVLQEVASDEAKGEAIALPQNALVEVAITCGSHAVRRAFKSDNKTDQVLHLPNMPYGEYSNRMSKQLRVGFLGIPAKMFANSLFYSGRYCKSSRVRRVAVTISNANKMIMPQPNMLYTRLFENDAIGIFGRFRHTNWQKAQEYSPDQHAEQLMKKYTGDSVANSPSKRSKPPSAELQVVEILAGYVALKLSKRDVKQQGTLMPNKISLKDVTQVVSSVQPGQLQAQQPMPQHQPMHNVPSNGSGASPQSMGQGSMAASSMPQGQQQNLCIMHPAMQMQHMQVTPMQQSQMQHAQMTHAQMASNSMARLAAQQQGQMMQGLMSPGSMQHGQMSSGSMTPKQMGHGQMTPGSVTPNQMQQVNIGQNSMQHSQMGSAAMQTGQMTPGSMGGMTPSSMQQQQQQQQQMSGNAAIQMQMEQMKRHPLMDMVGKRRPMMQYEQRYHPQIPMPQQYRYRPMPEMNMMRVPMYPMAMYNKQIPYPKAHEDQYRSQHMQR